MSRLPQGLLVLVLLASAPVQGAPALGLDEVLSASVRSVPMILESEAGREAAEARVLAARGAFDRRLEQSGSAWANGFYDGRQLDTRLVQPLADFGAEIYAGYRISDGEFPVYEDELVTLDGGELSAGIALPLLRDRDFDERRYRLRAGELGLDLADAELQLTRMEVQHDAMIAYWRWLAAGRRLAVFDRLLEIAEARDVAFRQQLAQGDVAEIEVVENYQNVLKRRSLQRTAARDFELAAVALSFYLRDEAGRPLKPAAGRLPGAFPTVSDELVSGVDRALARALIWQPSLRRLETQAEQVRNRLRLARNRFEPELDLGVKVARDMGDGSDTRNGTDVIAELNVSVPVQRREARGEIAEAEAELRRLQYARQRIEERLELEVRGLVERVRAAAEFSELARQEARQAQTLEEAEWVRFREGASSFFLLNVREENTADARVRALAAMLGFFEAVADYRLATADIEALGLGPLPPEDAGAQ